MTHVVEKKLEAKVGQPTRVTHRWNAGKMVIRKGMNGRTEINTQYTGQDEEEQTGGAVRAGVNTLH